MPLPPLVVPGPHSGVLDRLAELAAALPDQPALEAYDGELTFAELYARVRVLATELARRDAADGGARRPVGLYAEQGTDSLAAFLAITASGCPCVTLDVMLPDARLAQVVQLAGVSTVLAEPARQERAAALPGVTDVLGLTPTTAGPVEDADVPVTTPDDGASLVFTSGSTGAPKGVLYTQRFILSCGALGPEEFRVTPADRLAFVMPIAFAAGQITFWDALLNGATVCARDPRVRGLPGLPGWLDEVRPTLLVSAPALVRALHATLPAGAVLPYLRLVVTGGEKVNGRDVTAFRTHLTPEASFMNWMGSSETGSLMTFEIRSTDPVPSGVVPGGRAVSLRELEVLDEDRQPVAPGEVGGLYVRSAYLAAGYWGAPELTAARFERMPDGRTRYGTGDRARIGEDGVVHLLGRADDSVKIRGYLVEPGEVEAALLTLSEVKDSVVRAVTSDDGDPRLVAWVVPDPAQRTASPALVRAGASVKLPEWMVPRDVVLLDALPRTERGKVDFAALPPVPPRPRPVPPATTAETSLAAIWAPILHLDEVGRDESFTALGGDSLAVEEMLAAVTGRLGVSLTTADLAEHPTLSAFARLVDESSSGGRPRGRAGTLVEFRTTGSRPPLFCFAGAGGAAAAFEALAGAMGPEQPFYGLQVHGFENRGIPDWTVGRAARRYLEVIEQVAPDGPVVLVGHSLGGLFALAVAHLLQERGRQVVDVVLLDTYLPLPARGEGAPRQLGPAAEPLTPRELWRTRFQVVTAGMIRRAPEVQKEVFHQHGARVARFHRPRPWAGRALLVMSNENPDLAAWWDALLVGDHEIRSIDADHLAMLRRPYVDGIAELITADVDRFVDS
ncbi:alpha/beta fold hydrolase [Modestobacter sp. VKM Ac-2986]|uniref:alpha/beta fold hydrolase n=1 Tax=Modestobacter sp. VKM Ac-2986 TaxID=3004140 RepID=UPI0022AB6B65|nr:alpha/beta fold hydrolase [Modestobacter sp. VKM Ac-2986]MCZ2829868.1 alpha/beta fold hydrolase [Modestobacter sp. VKM Ac-2986]